MAGTISDIGEALGSDIGRNVATTHRADGFFGSIGPRPEDLLNLDTLLKIPVDWIVSVIIRQIYLVIVISTFITV